LIVSFFNSQGNVYAKRRYSFLGEKFNIEKLHTYFADKNLVADGYDISYREDSTIREENIYNHGVIRQRITYGSGGYKYELSNYSAKGVLDGEYKIWNPNGSICLVGNYKNNLKDGEFQLFDSSGTLLRKGIYKDGFCISGNAVVPDVLYSKPEVFPSFSYNNENLFDYILKKSLEINEIKSIKTPKKFRLSLVIDSSGYIKNIQVNPKLERAEMVILNQIFIKLPPFRPATIENIPVKSLLDFPLTISSEGIKETINNDVCQFPTQLPTFPGGTNALQQFISNNLKYPKEAIETYSQGKVFVRFIINEEGAVTALEAVSGINQYLKEEALRVVRLMPRWIPGMKDGKPVKVNYTLPINFKM